MTMLSKVAAAVLCALLPPSVAAADRVTRNPGWMVGRWAWLPVTEQPRPGDCRESDDYAADGYVTYGEVGGVDRWRIEGDRLIRVVVVPMAGGDRSEIGHVFDQRFTRVGAGELVFREGGLAQKLVRCDLPADRERPRKRPLHR